MTKIFALFTLTLLEIVLGIDCAFLGNEITHVAIGGQHLEILAEVFLDGLRLGRRFHDDQVGCHGLVKRRSPLKK